MKLCYSRKTKDQNSTPDNHNFYQTKTERFNNFFHRKKPKLERKLTDDVRSRRGEGKKLKRKHRKYKHKSWRNRSKNGKIGREKLKSEWIPKPFFERTLQRMANNAFVMADGCPGTERNCGKRENPKKGFGDGSPHPTGREPPQQKAKPWPHFVYHRVSSNFLHPEPAGHTHRQSAYVAISVATSSKPETTDDNS